MDPFAANRLDPMFEPSLPSRFIAELRHEIAAVPFDPTDFIRPDLVFPTRSRFAADLGEALPRRGIASPEPAGFRRMKRHFRIEGDLEIFADLPRHLERVA